MPKFDIISGCNGLRKHAHTCNLHSLCACASYSQSAQAHCQGYAICLSNACGPSGGQTSSPTGARGRWHLLVAEQGIMAAQDHVSNDALIPWVCNPAAAFNLVRQTCPKACDLLLGFRCHAEY